MTRTDRAPHLAAILVAVIALGAWPYHEILGWLPWGADAAKWVQHGSFDDPHWWRWAVGSKHFVGYRPVTALSFVLNYALTGYAAWGYRATDLGLHVTTGFLLFALFRRFTGDRSAWGLVAVAILFLHPATEEVVPHAARRSYLLATAFGLGGLLAWLETLEATSRRAMVLWALLAAELIGLGVLSNELAYGIACVFPLVALVRWGRARPGPALLALVPTVIVLALALARRYVVLGALGGYAKRYFAFVHRGVPMWRELPTWQPKRIAEALWEYTLSPTGVSGAAPLFGVDNVMYVAGAFTAWLVWVGVLWPAVRARDPVQRIRWVWTAWALGAGAIVVLSQTWFWRQAYGLLPPIGLLVAVGLRDAVDGLRARTWAYAVSLPVGAGLVAAAVRNGPLPVLDHEAHATAIAGTPAVYAVEKLAATLPSPAVAWIAVPLRASGAHIVRLWSERLAKPGIRFRLLGHLSPAAVDARARALVDRVPSPSRPTLTLRDGYVFASGAIAPGAGVRPGEPFPVDRLWREGPPAWVIAIDPTGAFAVAVTAPPPDEPSVALPPVDDVLPEDGTLGE